MCLHEKVSAGQIHHTASLTVLFCLQWSVTSEMSWWRHRNFTINSTQWIFLPWVYQGVKLPVLQVTDLLTAGQIKAQGWELLPLPLLQGSWCTMCRTSAFLWLSGDRWDWKLGGLSTVTIVMYDKLYRIPLFLTITELLKILLCTYIFFCSFSVSVSSIFDSIIYEQFFCPHLKYPHKNIYIKPFQSEHLRLISCERCMQKVHAECFFVPLDGQGDLNRCQEI